jgi:hypothetical protein
MPETSTKYYLRKLTWRTCLVLLFVFTAPAFLKAQDDTPPDTSTVDESYKQDSAYQNPHKAALLSAIIPGLGQAYNKKYWKVPIVYAGFGTFAFFIRYNEKGYLKWRQAYIDYPNYDLGYDFPLTKDQIDRTKNSYKRYRDLCIIGTAGFYILQIIDATVDAYLFDWDVSDDISMKIEPAIIQSPSPALTSSGTLALRASFSF